MPYNLDNVSHNSILEELTDILCARTQNSDRLFFRAIVAHFLGKAASNMRATVETKDRGSIPVNIYSLCLATSGAGKGYSVGILENEIFNKFRTRFVDETMPTLADSSLWDMANERAAKSGTEPEEEKEKLDKQYASSGEFPFTFDSGSAPAVKQLREKLLLAKIGSISLAVDEIGSNLINSIELLNIFLELYDQGQVKMKLIKNSVENKRAKDLVGKTPANMLLFGTPSKLLDGHVTENTFYEFLETGYARRCLFAWGNPSEKAYNLMTPEEAFAALSNHSANNAIGKWSAFFEKLACPTLYNWKSNVPDAVSIELLRYKFYCEEQADLMPEHEVIRKAEISHRYFKALKLAGVYSFLELSPEVTLEHLNQAIKLVEESGSAFDAILTREKPYVKLAKFIANQGEDVTHADLHEALPFYKTGNAFRNEIMSMAVAWGYKNHVVIKKSFTDGIEFFSGESLKETDLNELKVSYSNSPAYGFQSDSISLDNLVELVQMKDFHFVNHHFLHEHRNDSNVINGFNILVFDIDGTIDIEQAKELMSEYTYVIYTTKSHTADESRFRLILPLNYNINLDKEEYKEMVNSVLKFLPFECDPVSNQRSRKWRTNDQTQVFSNTGKLLDILPFIPRTSRNEDFTRKNQPLESLTNLERWFAQRFNSGNRNNSLLNYALALVSSGMSFTDVEENVKRFNSSLSNGLDWNEIESTIMVTVARRYAND